MTYPTRSFLCESSSQLVQQCAAIGQKYPVWQSLHKDNLGANKDHSQSRQVLRVPLEGLSLLLVGTATSAVYTSRSCACLSEPLGWLMKMHPAAHSILSTACTGSLCAVRPALDDRQQCLVGWLAASKHPVRAAFFSLLLCALQFLLAKLCDVTDSILKRHL